MAALLELSAVENVYILDSCGVGSPGSNLLVAGIEPVETVEIDDQDAEAVLRLLDEKLSGKLPCMFTLSYDLGARLLGIGKGFVKAENAEPDLFIARFDKLVVHDYDSGQTRMVGDSDGLARLKESIETRITGRERDSSPARGISDFRSTATSNFTKANYLSAVEDIKELIRAGETYQTNLTQQITVRVNEDNSPAAVFSRLRKDHPAAFSAYLQRSDSTVVSASPESFFRVAGGRIESSPIKGTRRRGNSSPEDERLRRDLLTSTKDRAENTMIVDLVRNDLGRVCDFGTVTVDRLCELEEHPTLFHLVSTVSGDLHREARMSDILRAVFPCGSITGAPKIATMRIIDSIEPTARGLSMGGIGLHIPQGFCEMTPSHELSVAIRTIVMRNGFATFNVGGGVTIDSDPEDEYNESLTKAKALLTALRSTFKPQIR
jgi:para-aminobenzoate synthetase component 1